MAPSALAPPHRKTSPLPNKQKGMESPAVAFLCLAGAAWCVGNAVLAGPAQWNAYFKLLEESRWVLGVLGPARGSHRLCHFCHSCVLPFSPPNKPLPSPPHPPFTHTPQLHQRDVV